MEFTCGLIDLPSLKRKYLGKKNREKKKKVLDKQRRKSYMADSDDESMLDVKKFESKSKIGTL